MTIPKFAAREGRRLLAMGAARESASAWQERTISMRSALSGTLAMGDLVPVSTGMMMVIRDFDSFGFYSEGSMEWRARTTSKVQSSRNPITLVVDLREVPPPALVTNQSYAQWFPAPTKPTLSSMLAEAGLNVATMDLRATGDLRIRNDAIGRAPDHNSAEWSLWLGRPMLGQWVVDIQKALDGIKGRDWLELKDVTLVGIGPAGAVAICAAALDKRITRVVTTGSLASYITDVLYENQRLGIMAPGIVRDVGDIAQLAALIAPRRLIIANPVSGSGKALSEAEAQAQFASTRAVYRQLGAEAKFTVTISTNLTDIVRELK